MRLEHDVVSVRPVRRKGSGSGLRTDGDRAVVHVLTHEVPAATPGRLAGEIWFDAGPRGAPAPGDCQREREGAGDESDLHAPSDVTGVPSVPSTVSQAWSAGETAWRRTGMVAVNAPSSAWRR